MTHDIMSHGYYPGDMMCPYPIACNYTYMATGLLNDLSQITFVLDDMSQKGAICTKIIWTICHNFF